MSTPTLDSGAMAKATLPETKHTPGPWRYSAVWRPPVGMTGQALPAGNVFWGYSISGSSEGGAPILPTLAMVHNFPEACEANARLIARAPDLLADNERLREAGAALANYAWSAVRADCVESTAYLQSLIDNLRAALSEKEDK